MRRLRAPWRLALAAGVLAPPLIAAAAQLRPGLLGWTALAWAWTFAVSGVVAVCVGWAQWTSFRDPRGLFTEDLPYHQLQNSCYNLREENAHLRAIITKLSTALLVADERAP